MLQLQLRRYRRTQNDAQAIEVFKPSAKFNSFMRVVLQRERELCVEVWRHGAAKNRAVGHEAVGNGHTTTYHFYFSHDSILHNFLFIRCIIIPLCENRRSFFAH